MTPSQPELGHGVAPGLDKRTLIKLRRGQFRVEDDIDLHNFTQEQAHRALDAFLAASHAAGRRCVLVITGKGLKSDGTIGALRHGVPHWLNLPPNRARVLAFCHATPADGGEGALYVLLRRPR
jgi:DNA-nicking Smr family endonuclease